MSPVKPYATILKNANITFKFSVKMRN
jgi:hypothetical protein